MLDKNGSKKKETAPKEYSIKGYDIFKKDVHFSSFGPNLQKNKFIEAMGLSIRRYNIFYIIVVINRVLRRDTLRYKYFKINSFGNLITEVLKSMLKVFVTN